MGFKERLAKANAAAADAKKKNPHLGFRDWVNARPAFKDVKSISSVGLTEQRPTPVTLPKGDQILLYSWTPPHMIALANQSDGLDQLQLIREPDNNYDDNAIQAHGQNGPLGYLPREDASRYAKILDGISVPVWVQATTCTTSDGQREVVISIAPPKTLNLWLRRQRIL